MRIRIISMKLCIAILLTLFSILSRGQNISPGTFTRQNPAGDYSVATTITLKSGDRFIYEFSGHMIQEKAEGSFRTSPNDGIIVLTYDTANLNDRNYRNAVNAAPKKYKYAKDRLYEIGANGRPIKSQRLVSNHRRFYIFGDYSRRRKVFLQRVGEVPVVVNVGNTSRQ